MSFKYVYKPSGNVREIVDEIAGEFGLTSEGDGSKFESLDLKAQVLIKIGNKLKHFVPSSKLHYIENIEDVKEFYSQPVQNITEYAQLARDETVPENLAIREHPIRFHPNDKESVHGGLLFGFVLICIDLQVSLHFLAAAEKFTVCATNVFTDNSSPNKSGLITRIRPLITSLSTKECHGTWKLQRKWTDMQT
jgi:hypothetical protein